MSTPETALNALQRWLATRALAVAATTLGLAGYAAIVRP